MINITSLYEKADTRIFNVVYGLTQGDYLTLVAVRSKLRQILLDQKVDSIDHAGCKDFIEYNVRVSADHHGNVKLDKRTISKKLRDWIDCPYEIEFSLTDKQKQKIKDKKQAHLTVSYRISGGTYEYPNEVDFDLFVERINQ